MQRFVKIIRLFHGVEDGEEDSVLYSDVVRGGKKDEDKEEDEEGFIDRNIRQN